MTSYRLVYARLCVAALAAGCAQIDPQMDLERTAREVDFATGTGTAALLADDPTASAMTEELLCAGLTADEAVQVALLNSPHLRAALLRVGISRADLVQSGLFSNPSLTVSLRWPDGGGLTNLQTGLAQNIADLWQLPYRKQQAQLDLDRTILEVAREASVLALDVRSAYWRAVRANRAQELAGENLAIAQRLVELVVSRRDAGAGSDVDVNLARSQFLEWELKLRNHALAMIEARSELARLLGLTAPPDTIELSDALEEPVIWTIAPDQIVAAAWSHRLDVRATRMAVEAAQARVLLEKTRFLRSLELGVSGERSARGTRGDRNWLAETAYGSAQAGQLTLPSLQPREPISTDWVVGPEIGVELPLFDQNQAQIAKAGFVHQQALRVLDALERELMQDAHVALARARIATDNAHFYKSSVLPLRETGLALAQSAYSAGGTTLLAVQEAQRLLLEARAGYVDVLTQHALAVVELERVAGRPFRTLRSSTTDAPVVNLTKSASAAKLAENQE